MPTIFTSYEFRPGRRPEPIKAKALERQCLDRLGALLLDEIVRGGPGYVSGVRAEERFHPGDIGAFSLPRVEVRFLVDITR